MKRANVTQHRQRSSARGLGSQCRPVSRTRWGRNEESFGDDSFLTGALSAAFIRGMQVSGHKYFKTENEAIGTTIRNGINQILWPRTDVVGAVRAAFEAGAFRESDLDRALRGKFRTVIRLGLLDPPAQVRYSRIGIPGEPAPWSTEGHKAVARDVAHESIVLLKNARATLPLDRTATRSVAVIGRFANQTLVDLYGGELPYAVTVLDGIRRKLGPAARVQFAANDDGNQGAQAARSSDVALVVVGNHPFCGDALEMRPVVNPDLSTRPCPDPSEGREGRDRLSLDLADEALINAVFAANRRTIVIVVSSFPYAINWTEQNVPAVLWTTHAAQEQSRSAVREPHRLDGSRPRKELKGFTRVFVRSGETRTVEIPLRSEDLAYWDHERSRWNLEQGSVMVMAGGSSARAAIQRTLTVGRPQR